MSPTLNIYCDESCHLPNDGKAVMVLGAITCPVDRTREISTRLRQIREAHNLPAPYEVKWTKVSPAKLGYYTELIDFFFDEKDLKFRAVVAPKGGLDHERFGQTHDDWYYKMMYQLLRNLLGPGAHYRIYLDKKDTRSGEKVDRLHGVLGNTILDFDRRVVERVQIVESHDVIQLQLADLLLGAVSYVNRRLVTSDAKIAIVERIKLRSGHDLARSTPLGEDKLNIFHWRSQG